MTQGKPPVNLLDELGFVLEERAGVWVVQEDAGGCYPASLTERVLWKALLEMHQQRQCLHKISEPADASADQHPDDAAVDALAEAMKAKLAKQRARGYGGWKTPECTQQRLSDMLRGHVDKGDPVDVANFCAFLAARGEGIAQEAPAAVAPQSDHEALRCTVGNCTFNGEVLLHSATCPNRPSAVAGPTDTETLHITHGPLMRHAAYLLRSRKPTLPEHESVASELESAADGYPTPSGEPSQEWLEVARIAAAPQPPAQAQEPVAWPKDAAEVREFFRSDFIRAEYVAPDQSPCDNDRYYVSAHDFLSAVNWWADFPHHPAPQQPAPTSEQAGASFQARVQPWMMACFGPAISADRIERNHRYLEESLELVQATGCTAQEAHQLVDYVFGRPVGEPAQEVGGAMVTLAALCLANGLDMHDAAEVELARIWKMIETIRAKQATKPRHSPLPAAPSVPGASERGLIAFREVINYVCGAGRHEEPLEFLRCWNEGNFSALRKEWPDAPPAIFYADPLADHAAIDAALAQS